MIGRNIKPVADYRWSYWWGASAFVKKGADIRREVLLEAVQKATAVRNGTVKPGYLGVPGVSLHHEGGRAYCRHCRRLVKDGLLKMVNFRVKSSSHGGSNDITWSVLAPTAKGYAEAEKLLKKAA
jgi:hypothetical protein